jgi:multidrug resistance efflux pump
LEQQTLDAEYALKSGEAKLKDLQVTLVSQTLTQRAELARLETELTQAKLNYELQDALFKEGLVKPLPYKLAKPTLEI